MMDQLSRWAPVLIAVLPWLINHGKSLQRLDEIDKRLERVERALERN